MFKVSFVKKKKKSIDIRNKLILIKNARYRTLLPVKKLIKDQTHIDVYTVVESIVHG